jgi:hypothetical protein
MDNEGLLNLLKSYEPQNSTFGRNANFRIVFGENGPELVDRKTAILKMISQKAIENASACFYGVGVQEGAIDIAIDYEETAINCEDVSSGSFLSEEICLDSIDKYLDDLLSEAA